MDPVDITPVYFGKPADEFTKYGITLKCTCSGCPEQYDAIDENTGNTIGYLRLRHGCFTVDLLGEEEKQVLAASPRGDGWFEEDEREKYLSVACQVLRIEHARIANNDQAAASMLRAEYLAKACKERILEFCKNTLLCPVSDKQQAELNRILKTNIEIWLLSHSVYRRKS